MKNKIIFTLILLVLFVFYPSFLALAQGTPDPAYFLEKSEQLQLVSGDDVDPGTTAVNIINYVLGFLSLIAVTLIIIGGFMWMTAAGSDERVTKAKKILSASFIGIVIILLSWVIAQFVINLVIEGSITGG